MVIIRSRKRRPEPHHPRFIPTLPEIGNGGVSGDRGATLLAAGGDSRRRAIRRRRGRRDDVARMLRERRGKLGEDGLETHAADMLEDVAEFSPIGSFLQGPRGKTGRSPEETGRSKPRGDWSAYATLGGAGAPIGNWWR
jgi:hypothetical protein